MFGFGKKRQKKLEDLSMHKGVGLITAYAPKSHISEQFRTLRTNIQYSNADQQIKTLVFTSSGPAEGKSTISANVAVTFANQGLRTLLVDADTRRPTVHATFSLLNERGLVNLLTSKEDLDLGEYIVPTSVEHLSVLPTGPVPPNPSELLSSKRMERLINTLSKNFDMVIFDVPPLGSVTDAQILASKVDATVLVVPFGIAQKGAVIAGKGLLEQVDANIIGVVQNRVPQEATGYYGYYGYYGNYGYYGKKDKDDKAAK
ncbi:CpsD/CapB family tyrosine-protein kinase [Lacticaseibacillus porcinae]|uniref:CpsD/CapB family tyrosine-protein kinase n=1 Tax=Lacticaseibacillus porcinae TaxID=1123687 RepID=UPI000F7B7B4A|nr:CpsD/CapB family tyrosine-protein kinase [Lacticaseibacillus porcinae]